MLCFLEWESHDHGGRARMTHSRVPLQDLQLDISGALSEMLVIFVRKN